MTDDVRSRLERLLAERIVVLDGSWGVLIQEGANFMLTNPMQLTFPALFFSLTLFSLNFLGDGLRDALDPKAAKD